ncbi:MAG: hypothetical protein U9N85_01265 [Bacteroidota bacterium]|nr:hypothetical protein [Bacteroidota bacterium]
MKKNKIYTYDYPKQRAFATNLRHGDYVYIAELTGYSHVYIYNMCVGKRKMTDNVHKVIEKIYETRKEMKRMADEQKTAVIS